jgi:type II secretory pathway pseudopilin PulG
VIVRRGNPAASRHRLGRRGVALVTALALLAFAAALLAGSFASATALAQAQRSARASAEAEALGRRAVAEVLAAWPANNDFLPVRGYQEREAEVSPSFGRTVVRTRIHRISASLYSITADVRMGSGPSPIAHRRSRLILERRARADSGAVSGPPHPIARWSFSGSY